MFKDRKEAGQLLAKRFSKYKNQKNVLVLAIPRGGIVTGYEIAKYLNSDLDIIVIKKIGFPGNPELALGAASLDSYYLNEELVKDVEKKYLEETIKAKQKEAKEKYDLLRKGKSNFSVKNKIVILTDDGIATGTTISLAIQILKKQKPKKLILAIPVASSESVLKLKKLVDEIICLDQPENLMAIGEFYEDFTQVEDEKAKKLLEKETK